MDRRHTPRLVWLHVAGLFVLLAGSVAADYRSDFRQGYQALDRKRYEEAVTWFQKAIAERPQEGGLVTISGTWRRVYLPHFHLGVALAELGRTDEALLAFRRSRAGGALTTGNDGEPQRLASYLARADLQQAAQRQAGAERPSEPGIAPPAAPTPTVSALDTVLPSGQRSLPFPSPPDPSSTPSTRRPEPILSAARAFFGGDYRGTVAGLEAIGGHPPRWMLQAYLFRAAARHALFVRSGELTLRAAAIADVKACRALDQAFAPGIAFSPKFQAFYRSILPPGADSGTH